MGIWPFGYRVRVQEKLVFDTAGKGHHSWTLPRSEMRFLQIHKRDKALQPLYACLDLGPVSACMGLKV